jgi:two-component system, LuxR family, response regulator FixJ
MSASDPTVFVVDDDLSVRRALARLLRAEGFQVRTFESGPEFLDAIDGECRGCAVLDVRMPTLSGFEVLDRLAARGVPMAVILVTGDGDVGTAERARKAGCVSLLAKPFEDVALIDAVREALRRCAGRSSSTS